MKTVYFTPFPTQGSSEIRMTAANHKRLKYDGVIKTNGQGQDYLLATTTNGDKLL